MNGSAELTRWILRRRDDTCLLVRVVLSVKPIRVYLILHQETPFVLSPEYFNFRCEGKSSAPVNNFI